MARQLVREMPMNLKDIVDKARKRYQEGEAPEKVAAWIADYEPPVYDYLGVKEYYGFRGELCRMLGDKEEEMRLSYLHAMVDRNDAMKREKNGILCKLVERYFLTDNDTGVLKEIADVFYMTNRFCEYIIVKLLLQKLGRESAEIRTEASYRINMDYFICQLKKKGIWILPVDRSMVRMSEFLGNILGRLGHRVFLLVDVEEDVSDDLKRDMQRMCQYSLKQKEEYPDFTVVPCYSGVIEQTGEKYDNMVLVMRELCRIHSNTDYADILATGRKMDECVSYREIKKDIERLSRYEGEIYEEYMTYGRIGNYLSYLEQIYEEPMMHLLGLKSQCRFSIVIPARNSGKYLFYAIQTCVRQRYEGSYEVLVCDNSEPGNEEVLRAVQGVRDRRVRYIHIPKEVSVTKSFEYACLHAQGEYILSIGSDDGILPWALEKLDKAAEEYPEDDVFQWQTIEYRWSDYDIDSLGSNTLAFKNIYQKDVCEITYIDQKRLLINNLQGASNIYNLSSGYIASMIKRSHMQKILEKTGRLWNGLCQDIYMGTVNAVLENRAIYLHYPLSIVGRSRSSLGAETHFQFDNSLKLQKRINELLRGGVVLTPLERILPDALMDKGLFFSSVLRLFSLELIPQDIWNAVDLKLWYRTVAGQFPKEKVVYAELMNCLRYSAMQLGEEFLKWFDAEIYDRGWEKQQYILQEHINASTEDMVTEDGWVILHMGNYGIKDVEGAARAAEVVMEL